MPSGTSNADLGAAKYEFGGMYFAFFTVNTAKYSPRYFRICKYGPYLAFLRAMEATRPAGGRRGAPGSVLRLSCPPPSSDAPMN